MRSKSGLLAAVLLVMGLAQASAQTRIVTGKVSDSLSNELVTSGQVSVQGTTISSTVKDDGTFTIAVPARDVVLQVRSIGYKRRDVPVTAAQNSIQVNLERDYFQLEAIVVTGQATGIERKNLANAVASVTAEQITKAPVASVEEALQGKMAGAQILQNSGAPGGGNRVRLRGVTSILGATNPLYVVDGVIISDAAIASGTNFVSKASSSTLTSLSQDNPVNRVADLNPNEIENVEVLKGAAASAIYGSKASNGVIIITTKRGRVGAPQFQINQKFGTSRLSNRIGSRYFRTLAEAQSAFTQGVVATGGAGLGWTAGYTPFDFEDELYNEKPFNYETSLSVNGGTENTKYFASGLVKHDGGVVHNTYDEKEALRLNLDQTVSSRVSFRANTEVLRTENDRGLTGNDNTGTAYGFVIHKTPNFYDMRATCPDGSRQAFCDGGVYPTNPYSNSNALQTASLFKNKEQVWRMLAGGSVTVDAIQSAQHTLRLSATGGADVFTQKNVVVSPPELFFEPTDGFSGTYGLGFAQNLNMNINANAVHTFKPSSAAFAATTQFGVQYETRDLNISRQFAQNLLGGVLSLQAGTSLQGEEVRERVEDFGFFGQEEFLTLGEKLLLTVGVRGDQSSNNGDTQKLFYYPKAAASYRLLKVFPQVDELKLRAAYGQSGNQPVYGAKFSNLTTTQIGPQGGFQTSNTFGATNIRPERQREIEGGFDATFAGSRANLEFTVYEKRINDLLLNRGVPSSLGYTTIQVNGGVLRTRGLEMSLNLVGIQTPTTTWSTRFNFAKSKSRVLGLPVPAFPISTLQTGAFRIDTATGYIVPGLGTVVDASGITTLWGNDTLPGSMAGPVTLISGGRPIGDITPKFTLSMANDVSYRALKVYWLWDWQNGGMLASGAWRHNEISRNSPDYATIVSSANCPATQTTPCQAGDVRQAWYRNVTTVYFEPAGYLKLREVQLSVTVPQSIVHRVWSGARYVRVGVSGRGLLQISPYRGGDPEAGNFNFAGTGNVSSLPGARELMAYPPSRSFWLNVDVGF